MKNTYDAQISPVQQIAQTLCAITLDNALAPSHLGKIKHVMRQLIDAVLQSNVASVHNVNSVRLGIGNLLLHEATESRQIGRDAGNAHHGALGRRVAPRFVVRGEHAQMATTHKLFIVQTEQRIGRGQEFGMKNDFDSVVHRIEQVAPSNGRQHGVVPIIHLQTE